MLKQIWPVIFANPSKCRFGRITRASCEAQTWVSRAGSRDLSRPGSFVALQAQLGLKLEPRKRMVEVLVLDNRETT